MMASFLTAAVVIVSATDAVRVHDSTRTAAVVSGRPASAAVRLASTALANDNRTPAGTLLGDTLVLRLTVDSAAWYLHDERAGSFSVLAFAEDGKPPTIPGPLIRVTTGKTIRVSVRNPLSDSLIVHGLGARGDGVPDTLIVPPGRTTTSQFSAGREGTYFYWATTTELAPQRRTIFNGAAGTTQLRGAFVVDPPGAVAPNDRIFVITEHVDQAVPEGAQPLLDRGLLVRDFPALNGKSWPHTERLTYSLGDSIRWRIINTTFRPHPMHLHGFYFRVFTKGNSLADRDSSYATGQPRMAVTEVVPIGETMSLVWSPDRPGGWLFHCHITQHASLQPPVDQHDALAYPEHAHEDSDQHALTGMNGMVLGVTVRGSAPPSAAWRPARRLRLFVQSDSTPRDSTRRFGYVLQRSAADPGRDSVESPGPVLVLTRGEPTSIEVVNRSGVPTAVHWHGIELESFFDGVPGWGGTPGVRTAPAIADGHTFEVHVTPRRAGTFMYHTHLDEVRQQFGGLVGAIVVLESGQRWDPEHDKVLMISDAVGWSAKTRLQGARAELRDSRLSANPVAINGSLVPTPLELRVGQTYRFRFADLMVDHPLLHVRLVRDSTILNWRVLAKDGFALNGAAERPSPQSVGSGETVDVEYTPDRPGDLMLEFGAGPRLGRIFGRLRVRVTQ